MTYDPSPSYPHHPPPAHQPPYQPPYQPPSPPPFPPHAPAPHQAPHRSRRRDPLGRHRDLRVLRGAYRWQRRTATLTALGYFTLFLLLSAYAPGFMTGTVTDGLPTGLLLALVQLPVTWLAIALYEQTARRRVDPLADRIRKEAELDARRGAGR
ncbi:DUF485 domain-containing protein [Streptomyces parvulus]|uniref:DUF485 domain-containing protein n=1 Tax=Streptomyces parvulus TaxID=146923 RepID=UPI001E5D52B1|nr:DUF485 domain-containing protein [Streptomyces parvulus]MCC9156477.1 DUF485 domain-containing protein [Streptomyces parvulus]MCE7688487.1 DUF485 domain-containing protein [Streptomyces parvulus]